jgi:hypothetical protein
LQVKQENSELVDGVSVQTALYAIHQFSIPSASEAAKTNGHEETHGAE